MSFLSRQLVKNIINQLGVMMTPEPALQILGAWVQVYDNPGVATVLDFGTPQVQPIVSGTVPISGYGYVVLTGTLTGPVTLVLTPTLDGEWTLDATAVTLAGHTVTAQANGNNWGTTIGTTDIYPIKYGGTGKLYGTSYAP